MSSTGPVIPKDYRVAVAASCKTRLDGVSRALPPYRVYAHFYSGCNHLGARLGVEGVTHTTVLDHDNTGTSCR